MTSMSNRAWVLSQDRTRSQSTPHLPHIPPPCGKGIRAKETATPGVARRRERGSAARAKKAAAVKEAARARRSRINDKETEL